MADAPVHAPQGLSGLPDGRGGLPPILRLILERGSIRLDCMASISHGLFELEARGLVFGELEGDGFLPPDRQSWSWREPRA
jgi:hypothetical protein